MKKDPTHHNSDYIESSFKCVEEPQTESWRIGLDKMLQDFAENVYHEGDPRRSLGTDEQTIREYVSNLLSKTRQEERQRVVKIAEGMRKQGMIVAYIEGTDTPDPDKSILFKENIGYNKGLSDLSSRVLEEEK